MSGAGDAVGRGEVAEDAVAVVGMSCRFPGAPSLAAFWGNLRNGVESISFFSREELAAEVETRLLDDPRYVAAKAVIEGEDLFDAALFGMSPREAEVKDPQHRVFLECAWEALEHAACDPGRFAGLIGVYVGVGANSYAWNVLARNPSLLASLGGFQVALGNDKDFLPTTVSYKLDLHGPSFSVQSACSTSLVAIHLACQHLLAFECDLALAGGVTIGVPQRTGYLFQEGGILSPDGHCRPFDARARGTAPGSGAGVVVLKRLGDALDDGDTVWAVVRGSAVNNDGGRKVGYTAPSVDGQAAVIAAAQAVAGVAPETIGYVEAHGTGTVLGDPIEIAALTQVFRSSTAARGFCAVGSVKGNIGHLDTAAGVAGFVKAVLALHHREIPPSLHFETPNPGIDFTASPFYVAARRTPWESENGTPRRAGVSSFGIGGTNCHLVLEEAPPRPAAGPSRPVQVLVLSARSESALAAASRDLAADLRRRPDLDLADVAHTLQVGRRSLEHRRALVARAPSDAAVLLTGERSDRVWEGVRRGGAPVVAFLFPGQGAQHPGMARGLYDEESDFREEVDRAAEILAPELGVDLRRVLFLDAAGGAAEELTATALAQPALFVVEHAVARLWMRWGVLPGALLGHSVGELAAACVAGVMSWEDGLHLVAARGRRMQEMPPGAMAALGLPAEEVAAILPPALSLAADNSPRATTVAGPLEELTAFCAELARRGVAVRRLHTSHAFHSAATEAVLPAFLEDVEKVRLRPPAIPLLSNLSGGWMTAEEATEPQTWVGQLRRTVRFSDACSALLAAEPEAAILEVGPGRTLGRLLRQHPQAAGTTVAASLPGPHAEVSDREQITAALGRLWVAGVEPDWAACRSGERRWRLPLPTYPFERRRYWVEPQAGAAAPGRDEAARAPAAPAASGAPMEPTETAVAGIWQELLGVESVGPTDDFFELGGTSLAAVSLMSRIEEVLGRSLPVSALSEGSTVAALAARLRAAGGDTPLVEIEPRGDGPPLFLVHPVGGDVLCYVPLARELGAVRPILALRAAGLEAGEEPLTDVGEMAERGLALLEHRQPAGPYLLGGWSFGGLVAFEMVRRLEDRGAAVDLVVLLDSVPPAAGEGEPGPDPAAVSSWFLRDLAGGRSLPDGLDPADLGRLGPAELVSRLLDAAKAAELLPATAGPERIERLLAVFRSNLRAIAGFRPRAVSAPILLVRAAEDLLAERTSPGAAPSWPRRGGGAVEAHTVAGNHYTMLTPPAVGAVAEVVRARLSRLATEASEGAALEEEPCL